jgi:hypothetical protein
VITVSSSAFFALSFSFLCQFIDIIFLEDSFSSLYSPADKLIFLLQRIYTHRHKTQADLHVLVPSINLCRLNPDTVYTPGRTALRNVEFPAYLLLIPYARKPTMLDNGLINPGVPRCLSRSTLNISLLLIAINVVLHDET